MRSFQQLSPIPLGGPSPTNTKWTSVFLAKLFRNAKFVNVFSRRFCRDKAAFIGSLRERIANALAPAVFFAENHSLMPVGMMSIGLATP